jgi:hypothetical protein
VLRLAALLGVLVAALGAAGAVAQDGRLRVLLTPSVVKPGSTVTIDVTVSPLGAPCSASVGQVELPTKRAVAGKLRWKWTVPAGAALGRRAVKVGCVDAGAVSLTLAVVRQTTPASVVIEKSGLSQQRGGLNTVGWGLSLANPSPDEDATDVVVVVDILDGSGASLGRQTQSVRSIPAGTTFWLGGTAFLPSDTPAARLSLEVRLGGRRLRSVRLPTVTGLRTESASDGGTNVLGQVTNTGAQRLSSLSRVSVVALNGSGAIVSGGYTFLVGGLAPGASKGFSALVVGRPPSGIATVMASVDARS